jgi:hypothetical protein
LRPSVFDALEQDDDEDDNPNNNKTSQGDRQAEVKRMNQELHRRSVLSGSSLADQQAQAAMAEDPSIFDYDGHYDEIQKKKEAQEAARLKQVDASVGTGEAPVSSSITHSCLLCRLILSLCLSLSLSLTHSLL